MYDGYMVQISQVMITVRAILVYTQVLDKTPCGTNRRQRSLPAQASVNFALRTCRSIVLDHCGPATQGFLPINYK